MCDRLVDSRAVAPDIRASSVHHAILKLTLIPAAGRGRDGRSPQPSAAVWMRVVLATHLSLFGKVSTPCECMVPPFVRPSYLHQHRGRGT